MANNTAEQAVMQTTNQTAQTTPGFVDILADPFLMGLIGIGIIALMVIGAIVYALYKRDEPEEEFEKEDLEDIVKPEFKQIVQDEGNKNGSTIRRDLRKKGEIYKDVRFTENDNLQEHMKKLAKDNDNDFNPEMNISRPDEEKLKKWEEAGVYSESEIELIEDQGVVPHRLMWTRPHKAFDKLFWFFTDRLAGMDKLSDYKLIPEHKITDNPGDNSVNVDRNIQLRPFAGIQLPLYTESFSILHAVITRRLYEASLEDQVNYSEKINFFDSKFSQQIQKLEAEADIENNKYDRGVAGDVNNS